MRNVLLSPVGYGRAAEVLSQMDSWNSEIPIRQKQNKYLKMAYSPFIFFRGTGHIFWSDFSGDWRLDNFGDDKTRTWVQGDTHVENFGAFHDGDHHIVYGLNDFDEAVVADYQYDLWRMAVSIVLVARQYKKISYKSQENMIDAYSQAYLDALEAYADLKNKQISNIEFTKKNTSGILKKFLQNTEKANSYKKMMQKWIHNSKGKNRFDLRSEKLDGVTNFERANIIAGMVGYGRTLSGKISYTDDFFKVKDIARRLQAGTGSLGTDRYYVLIENKTKSSTDDHILDVKHQGKPTPYYYLSEVEKIDYDLNVENDAQRHAEAYKAIAIDEDNYLGWMELPDGYYSVRERSPFKETFPTELLSKEVHFIEMAKQWAMVLASGHERSSRELYQSLGKSIVKKTKGRRKEFRSLVREIAFGYADQVQKDWGYYVESLSLTPADLKRQKGLL